MFYCELVVRLVNTTNYYEVGKRTFTHRPCMGDVLIIEYGEGTESELVGDCEVVVLRSVRTDGETLPVVVLNVIPQCATQFKRVTKNKAVYTLLENVV